MPPQQWGRRPQAPAAGGGSWCALVSSMAATPGMVSNRCAQVTAPMWHAAHASACTLDARVTRPAATHLYNVLVLLRVCALQSNVQLQPGGHGCAGIQAGRGWRQVSSRGAQGLRMLIAATHRVRGVKQGSTREGSVAHCDIHCRPWQSARVSEWKAAACAARCRNPHKPKPGQPRAAAALAQQGCLRLRRCRHRAADRRHTQHTQPQDQW